MCNYMYIYIYIYTYNYMICMYVYIYIYVYIHISLSLSLYIYIYILSSCCRITHAVVHRLRAEQKFTGPQRGIRKEGCEKVHSQLYTHKYNLPPLIITPLIKHTPLGGISFLLSILCVYIYIYVFM